MKDGFTIRLTKDVPTRDVVELYKDAGWWDESFDEAFVPEAIRNSYRFAGAFDEAGRLVGMARALSDGVSDAYILDITVLKEFRGCGIAREMVECLVESLEKDGIDWITAIGAPEAAGFYRKIGIEEMKGFIPLRFGSGKGSE